jgi:hypothetical protein
MKLKREGREKEVHSLRAIGIVWICLGILNPIFFILGIIFLSKSANMYKELEKEKTDINGFIKKNNNIKPSLKDITNFCPECGTRIGPEDFFCYSFGQRVNSENSEKNQHNNLKWS